MLSLYTILISLAVLLGVYLILVEFKRLQRHYDRFYRERLRALKEEFRSLKSEDGKISFLNRQLDKKISEIAGLYEVTREMSAALRYLDIFEILAKFLRRDFSFKKSRLILIDQKTKNIKNIYQIHGVPGTETRTYITKAKVHSLEPDEEALHMVMRMGQARETIKIGSFSKVLDQEKPYIPKDIESFLAAPVVVGNELIAIFSIEDLSPGEFDNFLILSRQFTLEMRKARLYKKVEDLAITDGLTGAYARRHFLERLDEELKRSKRHRFEFSFLMLDIDHFKLCNDTYGHLVGDAVLSRIVDILKTNVRQIDLVARYGGEEFSILLPETAKTEAMLVAERIRKAVLEEQFKVYDEFTNVSVSIGVATFPGDAQNKNGLIETADKALYTAKNEGRNRVCG